MFIIADFCDQIGEKIHHFLQRMATIRLSNLVLGCAVYVSDVFELYMAQALLSLVSFSAIVVAPVSDTIVFSSLVSTLCHVAPAQSDD
jgi:hypothetical protein